MARPRSEDQALELDHYHTKPDLPEHQSSAASLKDMDTQLGKRKRVDSDSEVDSEALGQVGRGSLPFDNKLTIIRIQ